MLLFRNSLVLSLLAASLCLLPMTSAEAGFTTFFGQDLATNQGAGGTSPYFTGVAVGGNTGTTNAPTAYQDYMDALDLLPNVDIGVEDFEMRAGDPDFDGVNPFGVDVVDQTLNLRFRRISPATGNLPVTATLEGLSLVAKMPVTPYPSETTENPNPPPELPDTPANRPNETGRYPVTDPFGGDQYLSTNAPNELGTNLGFRIEFSDPVAAFGFFGTDFGDFAGDAQLIINGDNGNPIDVPHPIGSGGGAYNANLLFMGLVGQDGMTISSVEFTNVSSNFDRFGFDNLVVATSPIPEPSTLALFGLGSIGLAVQRLRRRRGTTSV